MPSLNLEEKNILITRDRVEAEKNLYKLFENNPVIFL